jgi:hypothetical protein
MRRHRPVSEKRTGIRLNSAISCLALLATLAASGVFLAFQVITPRLTLSSPLRVPDLANICIGVQMLSCVLLLPMLWMWMPSDASYSVSFSSTLRRIVFLVLKILLLQSIVLSASLILLFLKPLEGFSATLGGVGVVLALRWVITDQQRRCPMCLRLLTDPILIGTSSRTFLEWYGAESACPHGHGLLLTSEIPSTWSKPQWIVLDDSWSDLFTGHSNSGLRPSQPRER